MTAPIQAHTPKEGLRVSPQGVPWYFSFSLAYTLYGT